MLACIIWALSPVVSSKDVILPCGLLAPSGYLLVAANVGDARTVISREGTAVQLSYDHKV